jgi:hypothetical protein
LWQAGVAQFDELRGIEWEWLAMDGALMKAPLGGGKTATNPTDRGTSGVKRSLLTEGYGVPIGLVVAGANRHDMKLVRDMIESIVDTGPIPPAEQPQGLCLDAGYADKEVYAVVHEFGFTAHVHRGGRRPKRSSEKPALKRAGGSSSGRIRG